MHRLLVSLSLVCKVLVQAIGLTLLDTTTQLSRNMAYCTVTFITLMVCLS